LPPATISTPRSSRWRPRRHLDAQCRPPRALHTWLDDKGSLTARLIAQSGGQFHVEIVQQYIALPARDEQQILHLSRPSLALIREVILCGRNQPWVFARSVLPLSSLTGELRHLRKQHNRPLGAFLFSQPQLIRSPIAVTAFNVDDTYVPAALAQQYPLWGRRSAFSLHGKRLLVSEVFLPAFLRAIDVACNNE
jgi:chorismate--pyruvate lyase